MSSVTETTGARGRPNGHSLRLAGDKTGARTTARGHSRLVRIFKYALPLSAVTAVGVYGLSVMSAVGWNSGLPALDAPQILPDNLAMENPHYEGFTSDGGRYWVKAARAQQDLPSMNVIKLQAITGELTDAQKAKTLIAAERGVFDSKSHLLDLFDKITITGDGGLSADLTRATVKTKEGLITSDQPVKVTMDAGAITANQLTIRQKAKEYTFVDDVRSIFKPRKQEAGALTTGAVADAAKLSHKTGAMPFGASDQPINVSSSRLDVNDIAKTALFSGTVVAEQAGATLSAPELEVSYEGAAASGASSGGAKVKRILAKSAVELRQSTGEIVTSRSADFDAEKQLAAMEGDVVITQGPEKRVTGDRAEFDQKANAMLVTGAVGVTQGANALRGGRLAFNRASNQMQLTSPGVGGRVFANFQQPTDRRAAASAPAEAAASQKGIPFAATFKTNPGAPVSVESATLDIDDNVKQAVFRGKVRAVQGDFVIQSSELTAMYSGSASLAGADAEADKSGGARLSKMKARKEVTVTSADGQRATGDWADFDTASNTATLGGEVVLTQGKNVVRGTKLVINMTTGEAVINTEPGAAAGAMISSSDADGAGQAVKSQRPSAVFYPREMKAQQNNQNKRAAPTQTNGQP